jgi:hypothetical protein
MKLDYKIQVIDLLCKDDLPPQVLFNNCLSLMAAVPGNNNGSLRHYNRTGYSKERLESIKYDLKKAAGVTDVDLAKYKAAQEQINAADDETDAPQSDAKDLAPIENPFLKVVKDAPQEVKAGYSLRAEFPFLYEADCPDEFKILVADKITAFTNFIEQHKELSTLVYGDPENAVPAADLGNKELYALGSEILDNYTENEDIYQELTYYAQHKEVLGKHPKLQALALQQEVDAMNKATLEKNIKNFNIYNSRDEKKIGKAKTEESRLKFENKINERKEQLDLMQARLDVLNNVQDNTAVNGEQDQK